MSDNTVEAFSERLRQSTEPFWSQAVSHRLVGEIYAGTVAPDVMTRYLVQDHRFIDCFCRCWVERSSIATGWKPS